MTRITQETKEKVVRLHIQEGRTKESLSAEYGVSKSTIANWVSACFPHSEHRMNKGILPS